MCTDHECITSQNHVDLASPSGWQHALDTAGLATLCVAIDARMGDLTHHLAPEDVLQEALLRAWRARTTVRWLGPRAFRAWLLTIVDNCISDCRSKETAAKRGGNRTFQFETGADGAELFEPACSTTPSRVASIREQVSAMRLALGELPDDVREAVRLRIFEQMPVPRIADTLGLPLSTVQHRVRRGAMLFQTRLRSVLARSDSGAPFPDAVAVPRKE